MKTANRISTWPISACVIFLSYVLPLFLSCVGPQSEEPAAIMTYEEYASLSHKTPYVLELSNENSQLVYYGSRHSYDPDDPMHADIEAHFIAMGPAIAFNEGGNPPTETDRDSAIIKYGEAGFLRHLGAKYDVPVHNADLPIKDEIQMLSAKYTKRELLLFYIVRQLGSYNSMKAPPDFNAYFADALAYLGPHLELPDANWEMVHSEFERVFGMPMVAGEVTSELADPVKTDYLTQQISRDASIARDRHIVKVLTDAVDDYSKAFAVMGASHVVMQESALRARMSGFKKGGSK